MRLSGGANEQSNRPVRRRNRRLALAALLLPLSAGIPSPGVERSHPGMQPRILLASSQAATLQSRVSLRHDSSHGASVASATQTASVPMLRVNTAATGTGELRGNRIGDAASAGSTAVPGLSEVQSPSLTVDDERLLEGQPDQATQIDLEQREMRVSQLGASGEETERGDTASPPPIAASAGQEPEPVVAVYEDQYLLEGDELPALLPGQPLAAQPFGREELAVDMTYYKNDSDFFGDDIERGARVYWSHETENWGSFDLDAQFSDIESSYIGRQSDGGEALVTLRQSAMPVSETALLDAAAGHQRTPISTLLHGGYRARLPSSTIQGVSTELSRTDSHWRFATGDLGVYQGLRLPRFVATGGRMTSVGYDQRVSDELELGGEFVNVSGDDDIRDHTSLLLGGRYTPPDSSQEHAVRLLADDDGNLAFWTDSRHDFSVFPTLRYGVFHFDADVVWMDRPIPRGQTGFYVRADALRNARYSLSAGYDYLETDLDTSSASSADAHSFFLTGSVRLRRALAIGINANLANRSITSTVDDRRAVTRLNAFALVNGNLGDARVEVFSENSDSDVASDGRERTGIGASFNWRMPERVRLTTELRVEDVDIGQRGATRQTELSALFRYDLVNNVSFGLNSSFYRTQGDQYAQNDGLTISADARWRFLPNWYASLSLNRNRADYRVTGPDIFAPDGGAEQSSIWLTVRYEQRTGQPYPRFGRTHDGMSGSGSVSGQVFFDLNRDSVRQPSEDVAVGAVVLLDGRYETRTDEQGRYSFTPVPTGAHEVSIITEALPLPWGLDDESPRRVVARFREDSTADFALIVME